MAKRLVDMTAEEIGKIVRDSTSKVRENKKEAPKSTLINRTSEQIGSIINDTGYLAYKPYLRSEEYRRPHVSATPNTTRRSVYLDDVKGEDYIFANYSRERQDATIANLQRQLDYALSYNRKKNKEYAASNNTVVGAAGEDSRKNLAKADREYIEKLESQISSFTKIRNSQVKADKIDAYNKYLSAEDYEEYAQRGANIENPDYNDATKGVNIFGKNIGGQAPGNIVTYSRDNWEAIALGGGAGDSKYRFMKENEVGIYNYLLAKEGEDAANEYLSLIDETLNQRSGKSQAENIDKLSGLKRAAITTQYGVAAGLDQYREGLRQIMSDTELPTTETQFGSAYVREDLADVGPKVLGSSLGQAAYDVVTTSAAMTPSILLSVLTGGLGAPASVAQGVGAAAMSASAMGSAYKQKLNEGYSQKDAKNYGVLVGAMEGAFQYVLGGIGALGGKLTGATAQAAIKNIDSALVRVAAEIGIDMLGEGVEEYLQTVLEPVVANLVLDENNEIKLVSEDAAYSFLLGAVSSALMGGGGTIASNVGKNAPIKPTTPKINEQTTATVESPKINDAVKSNAELDAYAVDKGYSEDVTNTLNRMYDGSKNAETYAESFNIAFEYGKANANFAALEKSVAAKTLSKTALDAAYTEGRKAKMLEVGRAERRLKETAATVDKSGSIKFEDSVSPETLKNLNEDQKNTLTLLGYFAKFTPSVNVSVFESAPNEAGKFTSENASYSEANGRTLRIDLNAWRMSTADKETLMMSAASHDLTHFMERNAPAEYQELSDFVINHLTADGTSLESLIERRIAASSVDLTKEAAMREVVAIGCEDVLGNSDVMLQMAQQNETLFAKIKKWFEDLISKIKDYYAKLNPKHEEAKSMRDVLDQLTQIYNKGLLEAAENSNKYAPVGKETQFALREMGLDEFSKETKNNIKLRGGEIVNNKQELLFYVEDAIKNPQKKKNLYLGAISNEAKTKIEQDTQVEIFKNKQYSFVVSYDDIIHITEHFGTDAASVANEVMRLYEIVKDYDSVKAEINEKGLKKLIFDKKYSDYDFRTVEIASNKKSTLDLVTLYVTKNNIKKRGLQSVPPAANTNGSQRGSKSSNQDITYSSDIVNNEEYSERNADFLTTRQVLLDTLEQGAAAQNEDEQRILDNYRKKINELSELEKELADIKAQIKEKSFTKGADRSNLSVLRDDAKRITEKISRADRKLLEIENLSAIETLVARERTKAEKRIKAKNAEKLAEVREKNKRRELRKRIERHAKDLSAKLLKPSDKKHIPEELRGAVAKLLENINLSSNYELSYNEETDAMQRVEKGTDPKALATKRTLAFENLRQEYSKLAGELVIDPELLGDDGLFAEVVTYADTPLADLTYEQLEAVYDVVRVIENSIATANKMLAESRFATVSDIAEKMRLDNVAKPEKKEFVLSGVQKLVGLDNLTPEAYFHRLGAAGDEMFRILRNAQDKHINIMAATERFTNENKLNEIDVRGIEKELVKVTLGGEEVTLSTAQLMELYVLMKREQGVKHILSGGILPSTIKGAGAKNISRNDPIKVTAEEIAAAIAKLSEEDKKVADMLQKYLSEDMSEYGNQASLEVYGYKKFTEQNYWPIDVVKQQLKSDVQKDTAITSLAGRGFAKSTLANVETAITLNSIFESFSNHVAEMATYSAYLAANEDVNRIRNFKYRDDAGKLVSTAKNVIERVHGKGGTNYLSKLLSDIAIGVKGTHSDSPFTGKLVSNLKAASVGANLRVIIQQPTAILRAMEEINPIYLTTGIVAKDGWKKAKQYAPIAKWKDWGYFEINTGRQMKDVLFNSDSNLDKARQTFMAGAGAADSLSWGLLWGACENETKAKRKDLKPGTQEFYGYVAKRFTEIVDKTQVVDGVLQRSQFMRSTDGLNKLAGSFMAEPTKQYNMFLSAAYDLKYATNPESKKKASKHFARTTFALLVSAIANAMAQSVIDAVRDDDEEKKFAEKWWENLVGITGDEENYTDAIKNAINGNLFSNFNPVQFIPYIKDAWSVIQGYDVSRMDMDAISDLVKAVGTMRKTLNGEGTRTLQGASIELVATAAKVLGLPISNLLREIKSLTATVANEKDMYYLQYRIEKFWNNISATQNKSAFTKILYNAYLNDKNAYKIIKADMIKSGIEAEDIVASLTERTRKSFEKGNIGRDKAESVLEELGEMSSDEAWIKAEEWEYKAELPEGADKTGYSKYTKIYELVLKGKDITSETAKLIKHGIKQSEIETAISDKLKVWYQGTETERQQISKEQTVKYLQQYCNMSTANAKAKAQEWTCKIVQGVDYAKIGEKFIDGELSEKEAKRLWTTYGNITEKQANEKISEHKFKKKWGFFYSDKNEAYKNEEIDATTLKKIMLEHGEDEADITATVKALDYFKANPKTDYSWGTISSYYKPKEKISGSVADKGISLEVFVQFANAKTSRKGVDADGDGKSDYKELLLKDIDNLNVSDAQKDILYLLEWSEKTLDEAPWH